MRPIYENHLEFLPEAILRQRELSRAFHEGDILVAQ